jgi:hypothetical protein
MPDHANAVSHAFAATLYRTHLVAVLFPDKTIFVSTTLPAVYTAMTTDWLARAGFAFPCAAGSQRSDWPIQRSIDLNLRQISEVKKIRPRSRSRLLEATGWLGISGAADTNMPQAATVRGKILLNMPPHH